MKKKPLIAASLALALTAAAAPTAVSAATESPESTVSQTESTDTHSAKFAEAMSNGKTAEETNNSGMAAPAALPALVGGLAAREGAKWAGKQLAKGALTEAGKRLIGTF